MTNSHVGQNMRIRQFDKYCNFPLCCFQWQQVNIPKVALQRTKCALLTTSMLLPQEITLQQIKTWSLSYPVLSPSLSHSSSFSSLIASSILFPWLWQCVAEPSLPTVPIGCVAGLESDKRSAVASIIGCSKSESACHSWFFCWHLWIAIAWSVKWHFANSHCWAHCWKWLNLLISPLALYSDTTQVTQTCHLDISPCPMLFLHTLQPSPGFDRSWITQKSSYYSSDNTRARGAYRPMSSLESQQLTWR